jgi:hypothetical protein
MRHHDLRQAPQAAPQLMPRLELLKNLQKVVDCQCYSFYGALSLFFIDCFDYGSNGYVRFPRLTF